MNLSEYQAKARETAIYTEVKENIYPTQSSNIIYPALGLVGECGEVAEKIKKLIRDDKGIMSPDREIAIAKELGDCCWYLANICCDTNLDLKMIHDMRGSSIQQRTRQFDYYQLILCMNRHTTGVVTALEHLYYDSKGNLSAMSKYTEIPQHMSHILACIEEFARRLNLTLENIYTANLEKLAGRKNRGTLRGDGDNR